MSLTHMALAFTLSHPAVSAAIIGPRTMDQLEGLLGAGEVALEDETLDRIDKLVPPGSNVNDADGGVDPAGDRAGVATAAAGRRALSTTLAAVPDVDRPAPGPPPVASVKTRSAVTALPKVGRAGDHTRSS